MPANKQHWYDGWFYDRLIAPNQDRLFTQIEQRIAPDSRVLDVGCGTGRLAFALAGKCERVLGIDLSQRNIERAKRNLAGHPHTNISFEHRSVAEIVSDGTMHFDYAVLTYVLHEVPEPERTTLLLELSTIADRIIVGDYLVPVPSGGWSVLNDLVEYAAGMDHYTNFKSFVANGGIRSLAEQIHFEVLEEVRNLPYTSHLMILQPPKGK